MSISDQIRRAIRKSGLTAYRIAHEAGVDQASLSRFLAGSGLTTTTLDAVADVLRLELSMKGPRQSVLRKSRRP